MKKIMLAVAAVLSLGLLVQATEIIETERVPVEAKMGEEWTLDFQARTPQRIVMVDREGNRQAYWYMVYVVTNETGEARDFIPNAVMFTDTGKFIRDGIYPSVVEAVKRQYRLNELKSSVEMLGRPAEEGQERLPNLKEGLEQAQQGIFVFPAVDERINSFKIFVTGLSGEFIVQEVPSVKEGEDPQMVVLRKTMELRYAVPGDETRNDTVTVQPQGKRWMWR